MKTERKVLLDSGIQSITNGEIIVKHLITGQTTKFENATLVSFSNKEVVIEIPYRSPFNYEPEEGEIIYVEGMGINCLMRFRSFSDSNTKLRDYAYLLHGCLVRYMSRPFDWNIDPSFITIRRATNIEIRQFHAAEQAAGVYWDVNNKSYKQIFTKDMLKPGMVVEYADGNFRLVTQSKKELFLIATMGCLTLDRYSNTLTHPQSNLTINKVYKILEPGPLNSLKSQGKLGLIWSRN